MNATVTLVLSFLDRDDNEVNITVQNPKLDLDLRTVTDVMQTIIENEGIISNKNVLLASVSNCYYRTVTKTPLTDPGGGE